MAHIRPLSRSACLGQASEMGYLLKAVALVYTVVGPYVDLPERFKELEDAKAGPEES